MKDPLYDLLVKSLNEILKNGDQLKQSAVLSCKYSKLKKSYTDFLEKNPQFVIVKYRIEGNPKGEDNDCFLWFDERKSNEKTEFEKEFCKWWMK